MKALTLTTVSAAALACAPSAFAGPTPVYLNNANTTVELGPTMPDEPFNNRSTIDSLASIIDAPSADAGEDHTQGTHVWTTMPLELIFTFDDEYDLTTLHIWNYFAEGFDVDNIDFTFFDANGTEVGTLFGVEPALGGNGGNPIFAEDIDLSFPSRVQSVHAILTGSNDEVDFNNIGFTGFVTVPAPATVGVLALAGLVRSRRRSA